MAKLEAVPPGRQPLERGGEALVVAVEPKVLLTSTVSKRVA
jgi:hypothetical protein